ncbi:hypothetical protein J3F84DRAFT_364833 [Trichoderma pleuroticola]
MLTSLVAVVALHKRLQAQLWLGFWKGATTDPTVPLHRHVQGWKLCRVTSTESNGWFCSGRRQPESHRARELSSGKWSGAGLVRLWPSVVHQLTQSNTVVSRTSPILQTSSSHCLKSVINAV